MNTYDFSNVPVVVTLTNTKTPEEVFDGYDAGTRAVKVQIPYSEVREGENYELATVLAENASVGDDTPVFVKRKYKNAEVTVQFYKTNTFLTLESLDSVKVIARSSAEVAHFLSLANDDLTVVVEEATSDDSSSEESDGE